MSAAARAIADAKCMSELRHKLGNMESDFRHLSNLIDVISDLTFERHPDFYPGHVDSLLWVAREFANRIVTMNAGGEE